MQVVIIDSDDSSIAEIALPFTQPNNKVSVPSTTISKEVHNKNEQPLLKSKPAIKKMHSSKAESVLKPKMV
jgi:hypothetical protein